MNGHPSSLYHLDARFHNGSYSNGSATYASNGLHHYHHHHPSTTTTTGPPPMMYKISPQEELKKRLIQGHLSYLNRDDTPEKLEHKTKLEGLIVEYLSLVPHRNKFESMEVADCFDKSIIENKDFTASRASAAFEVLEKYATNLLTKPWRKEFKTIYPYGGYMKGLVDRQLRGACYILYLMGYRTRSVNGVTVYTIESSIIDPDALARVSLDCLIAFVECQMMIQIADALKRKGVSISWLQILDIRASSICSMDQLVNFILDSNSAQKHLIDFETDSTNNLDYSILSHLSGQGKRYYQQQHHQNDCPVLRDSNRKKEATTISSSSNDGRLVGSSKLDNSHSRDLIHFSMDEPNHSGVYYQGIHSPMAYIAPPPMFASEFSTVSSSYPDTHQYKPHQSSAPPSYPAKTYSPSLLATNHLPQTDYDALGCAKNSVDVIDSGINSLNLKSSTQRIRSLDRRKESTTMSTAAATTPTVSDLTRCDESGQLSINNGINSNNNPNVNRKLEDRINSILKSFTNDEKTRKTSLGDETRDKRRDCYTPVVEKKTDCTMKSQEVRGKPANTPSIERLAGVKDESSKESTWSCAYCTFLNNNLDYICDMCSRSREKPGKEISTLVSGGKVCPLCTLVNSKNADNCSACEASLLNSPTYI